MWAIDLKCLLPHLYVLRLEQHPKKRETGCCAACLLCWEKVGRNVGCVSSSNSCYLFSGIEEPDWGVISLELIPVRVWLIFNCCFCETVEYRVILWTFLCPDSCIIAVGARFYIEYRQSKRCIDRWFPFPRVTFLRRLCRLLLDISGCSAQKTFFGAMALTFHGSFLERVLVCLSLNSRYSCPMEVLNKFYVSPWTHLSMLPAA